MERAINELSEIASEDRNIFCAGSALDALSRLGHKHTNPYNPYAQNACAKTRDLLRSLPLRSWESMLRSGIDSSLVKAIEKSVEAEPTPFSQRS